MTDGPRYRMKNPLEVYFVDKEDLDAAIAFVKERGYLAETKTYVGHTFVRVMTTSGQSVLAGHDDVIIYTPFGDLEVCDRTDFDELCEEIVDKS